MVVGLIAVSSRAPQRFKMSPLATTTVNEGTGNRLLVCIPIAISTAAVVVVEGHGFLDYFYERSTMHVEFR